MNAPAPPGSLTARAGAIHAAYLAGDEQRLGDLVGSLEVGKQADLVIGAVLVPGAKAPKLVTNSTVAAMKSGAVLVDIAIDQGGCFENSKKTSHDDPTFKVHDTLFYCVANMPGAVANTSTRALSSATLPYIRAVANDSLDAAIKRFPGLEGGVMTRGGRLVSEPVRKAFDWKD